MSESIQYKTKVSIDEFRSGGLAAQLGLVGYQALAALALVPEMDPGTIGWWIEEIDAGNTVEKRGIMHSHRLDKWGKLNQLGTVAVEHFATDISNLMMPAFAMFEPDTYPSIEARRISSNQKTFAYVATGRLPGLETLADLVFSSTSYTYHRAEFAQQDESVVAPESPTRQTEVYGLEIDGSIVFCGRINVLPRPPAS